MNAELTENVQDSIRPGEMVDTYYYGETNQEKQAYACIVNNKFTQEFSSKGAGTSQFVISPYQGVSDCVVYFKLANCAGIANAVLPQGWAYSLIKSVSVRYGSSAQYYFTGAQIFLQNLWECEDGMKRDQLASLGGNAISNFTSNANPEGYVYLNLPHCSPRADGKPLPFPSDLLVSPIVITIELNPIQSIFVRTTGTTAPITGLPDEIAVGELQVKQEMMSDSADLLARRVDMNTHAYTFPLKYFPQQEVQIGLPGAAISRSVSLTGFRAGEVRNILLWLTKKSNDNENGNLSWFQLKNVQLTYNGEVFYRANAGSSQMWNLVCDTKSAGYNSPEQSGNGNWVSGLQYWTDIPFAQVNIPYDKEIKLVHGKPILNAIVNVSFDLPDEGVDYTLHAVYIYNASLLCARGGAEYVF